jgi:hypothetical protein
MSATKALATSIGRSSGLLGMRQKISISGARPRVYVPNVETWE